MIRSIGPRTRVDSLKKEAKQWLKALRAGDAEALTRFRNALLDHHGKITLRTAQWALAREHGFAGWNALLEAIALRERELREVADEILKNAIFRGDHDVARVLFDKHPDVAKLDLYTAVVAGDLEEVERRLAADPAAASRAGGPNDWPPLLYLAYVRVPAGAQKSLEIARILLDRGADPNARWLDDWQNPFAVLTGVIGLGEGVKPPHERADELAELLLERGANPFDTQALYNSAIVRDDTHWLDVLWSHSERRGVANEWSAPSSEGKPSWLDIIFSIAIMYGHARRAEWLLAHGANPHGRNTYTKRLQREEAVLHGRRDLVALLERYGAGDAPLEPQVAFQVACRDGDFAAARRIAAEHPECLRDASALRGAAHLGKRDVVEFLLDIGMPVDIEDEHGSRALGMAARVGAVDVAKLLVERGADVDRPSKHYDGPLGACAYFGRREVAELLAPRSRDVHNLVALGMKERLGELFAAEPALVNLRHFRSGATPLSYLPADEAAAIEMARFLLGCGADPHLPDNEGETPARAARKRGLESLAALLGAPRES